MTDTETAKAVMIDMLNRADELKIKKLMMVITTETGQIAFGASPNVDVVSLIGMASYVKAMAESQAKISATQFTPFTPQGMGGAKPS